MSKLRHLTVYITFIISQITVAAVTNYYPENFNSKIEQMSRAGTLKSNLEKIISNKHEVNFDYKQARKYLFGQIDLKTTIFGAHYIIDRYCQMKFTKADGVGPGLIPNHNVLNCEHTWPQSRFNKNISKNTQKNDLHHLYAVWSRANSSRSNIVFGEVNGHEVAPNCDLSQRGQILNSKNEIQAFEPPKEHRGNVARAIFYFSTRYQLNISKEEEYYLRRWNKEDPVDEDEISRNNKIFNIQKNRNPYIDNPKLVDLVKDF